jgi:hypothetical protein
VPSDEPLIFPAWADPPPATAVNLFYRVPRLANTCVFKLPAPRTLRNKQSQSAFAMPFELLHGVKDSSLFWESEPLRNRPGAHGVLDGAPSFSPEVLHNVIPPR